MAGIFDTNHNNTNLWLKKEEVKRHPPSNVIKVCMFYCTILFSHIFTTWLTSANCFVFHVLFSAALEQRGIKQELSRWEDWLGRLYYTGLYCADVHIEQSRGYSTNTFFTDSFIHSLGQSSFPSKSSRYQ